MRCKNLRFVNVLNFKFLESVIDNLNGAIYMANMNI